MVSAITPERASSAILDQAIAALDKAIGNQLVEITQAPPFQTLKSLWFGLNALVDATGQARDVELDLLNVSKPDLIDDFEIYLDLTDSALFHHLYKNEYDQAGGRPYTSVLMQYNFAATSADISLLRQVSKVAASCHCPVIVNADPRLFSKKGVKDLEDIKDFSLLFGSQEYLRWRQFSQGEDVRYLGMALPRVLVSYEVGRRPPRYCRGDGLASATRSWTHATYAFGMILVRSFVKQGWCVYIRGAETGGLVEGLEGPELGLPGFDFREPPLEILFSDRQEQELAAQGLIPLCYHRQRERICLFSAPTMQNVKQIRSEGGQFDRLAASLPYLYLISRIAHYQKLIQRENIGLTRESGELEKELHQWLQRLITTMRDPNLEMRTERPLSGGFVKVLDDPANPGFFKVQLVVQPHLQLEGVNAKLELNTKMPRKKE